jgi:heme/copper-type cytochrome/quinol oxidase subunit 2
MRTPPARPHARPVFAFFSLLLLVTVVASVAAVAQSRREFTVTAKKYAYRVSGTTKPEIRVALGDLVRITFEAEDIPHSFTTIDDDHYRINRRAEPGKPVTWDFRADQAGTFAVRCTLAIDAKCKDMQATLIVEQKH